jgi:Fic family protein
LNLLVIRAIYIQNRYESVCIMPVTQDNIYKIQQANAPQTAHDLEAIKAAIDEPDVKLAIAKTEIEYLPWDDFRKKSWVPANKTELIWNTVSFIRQFRQIKTPITDKDGGHYKFNPQRHEQFRHEIDLEFGGNMLGISDFNEGDKRQIIRRNLIEESIASAKLEGANTSREIARRMLQEGRKPKNHGERMIVNNHLAMVRIDEHYKNQPLSFDVLFDLHRLVTQGTLQDQKFEGELRQTFDPKGNRLKIMPWDETTIAYIAPDREFVEAELPKLIAFANADDESGFIHPLFKAIMLHFWIGLLHPFEDGNGRLARIIFYWYMLRKGYWAFAYLSLSERILKSPKQYAMAYIYSEQDNYDLNYFIQYNVEKLQLARKQLQENLRQQIAENKKATRILQSEQRFNVRQIKLLQQLSKDEQHHTSVALYHNENQDIGYITAVSDLKSLVTHGFLKKLRTGRNITYLPTPKVLSIFK